MSGIRRHSIKSCLRSTTKVNACGRQGEESLHSTCGVYGMGIFTKTTSVCLAKGPFDLAQALRLNSAGSLANASVPSYVT